MEVGNLNKHVIPWESWINRENERTNFIDVSYFDRLCELAVSSYGLDSKSRKPELKDKLHFFIIWWGKNTSKTKAYKSQSSIANLLKKNHSTISFYMLRRVGSYDFEKNTQCIKDFLES